MQWNNKQEEALEKFHKWLGKPTRPFVLQGYAGTGKTTLTKQFLHMLEPGTAMALMAPTGKAARVMSAKTGVTATTIHKILYTPADDEVKNLRDTLTYLHSQEELGEDRQDEITRIEEYIREISKDNRLKFVKKYGLEGAYDLLIVDEASMIGTYIYKDIVELGIPTVFIGDPFQLPPVKDVAGWNSLEPDAVLTQIMRTTGEGAGINLAAQAVRIDEPMEEGPGFFMHPKKTLEWEEYASADIVLCGTHVVRNRLNKGIRKHLGYPEGTVVVGEKMICLTNSPGWDTVNGELFTVQQIIREDKRTITVIAENDLGDLKRLSIWRDLLLDDSNTQVVPYSAVPMTYAYAITVHKSQGSEWGKVIVTDSWRGPNYSNWLYTGLTRGASETHFIR
jgi:exodeoxyribonuclease-5